MEELIPLKCKRPDFPIPKSPLLIVGSGRGMWADLALYGAFKVPSHVMLINQAIANFRAPGFLEVKHAVCLDEDCVELYREIRQKVRRHKDDILLSHSNTGKCDVNWSFNLKSDEKPNDSGSFATAVAVALGYTRITLAGVPHDGYGHYYGPPWEELKDLALPFRKDHWVKLMHIYRDKVRSMSGTTRELFGYPSEGWLKGGEDELPCSEE